MCCFTELTLKVKGTPSFVPSAQDAQVRRSTLLGCPCPPRLGEAPSSSSSFCSFWASLRLPSYPASNSLLSWPITA